MNRENKRLKRKVRNSYIVSTVSIALVLFLLGSVGYLLGAAMKAADTLQRSVVVTVELADGLDDERKEALKARLTADGPVEGVAFVGKEEKVHDEEFRRLFGSEFEEILGENPLHDSFELTLAADGRDADAVADYLAAVGQIEGVARVSYPAQTAERIRSTIDKIRLVLLLFGGALSVVSLILVANTIRLAIYSKRYLINTMKLVGATKWFIMRPFLWSSLTQGVLAGVGAAVLFAVAVFGLNEAVPELLAAARSEQLALLAGGMVAAGVLISGLFTFFALNRFVNMQSNKIHLY